MKTVALERYDHFHREMCSAIERCHKVAEVKELRSKARALQVYAAQAQNYEAERQAAEIRIRAERRAGELLKGKAKGERSAGGKPSRDTRVLKDLGISYDQSSQWQKLAEVPTLWRNEPSSKYRQRYFDEKD